MNALNRDRNILKRLVESYGKQDVLKYVNTINESEVNYKNWDKWDRYSWSEFTQAVDGIIRAIPAKLGTEELTYEQEEWLKQLLFRIYNYGYQRAAGKNNV